MEQKLVFVFIQCLILATIYVLSLYVWHYQHDRNHPVTIKKRFISVFVVNLFSPIYLWFCLDQRYLEQNTLWNLMGIRMDGLLQAACFPLLLTIICFLGPIISSFGVKKCSSSCKDKSCFYDILVYRNLVVAPISEEVTFRACLIPLLSQCLSPISVVFICPVFFGAAHFNHFLEIIKAGIDWKNALCISCFQFIYTTIFGAYSTFLLLRTGHLIAPILAHAFCNHMGFPNIKEVMSYEGFRKYLVIILYIVGIILWGSLLLPVTEPHLYHNSVYWTNRSSFVDN